MQLYYIKQNIFKMETASFMLTVYRVIYMLQNPINRQLARILGRSRAVN